MKQRGVIASRALYRFAHGAEVAPGTPRLFGVYHPSQQNTQTGKLTAEMLEAVFRKAREILPTT